MTKERRIESLYWDLHNAVPTNPILGWIAYLEKPAWYQFRAKKAYQNVSACFRQNGFELNDFVAQRFFMAPSQYIIEDAGGAIIRKLKYALKHQLPTDGEPRNETI